LADDRRVLDSKTPDPFAWCLKAAASAVTLKAGAGVAAAIFTCMTVRVLGP
jgi:hypothetical protein